MPKNKTEKNKKCCSKFFKQRAPSPVNEAELNHLLADAESNSDNESEEAIQKSYRDRCVSTLPNIAYGFTIFMLVVMLIESTTENTIGMRGNLFQNNHNAHNNTLDHSSPTNQYPFNWFELSLEALLSLLISVPQILLFGRRKIFKYIEKLDRHINNKPKPHIKNHHQEKTINCTSYIKVPLYTTLYIAAGVTQYFLISYQAKALAKDAFYWEKDSWQSAVFANILASVGTGYVSLTEQAEIIKAAFKNISNNALGNFTSFLNRLLCCTGCAPATLIFGKATALAGAAEHGLMEGLALYALLMTVELPMALAIILGALLLTGASTGSYFFEGEELIKIIKKIIFKITNQKIEDKTDQKPLSSCQKKMLYGFAGFLINLTFAGHVALSAITLIDGFKDFYKDLYNEELPNSHEQLAKKLCLAIGFFPAIWDLMTEGVEVIQHASKRANITAVEPHENQDDVFPMSPQFRSA